MTLIRTARARRRLTRLLTATAASIAVAAAAGACTSSSPSPGRPSGLGPKCAHGTPSTLNVLSSSELADMKPILAQIARATGVTVTLNPVGSLTGAQEVINGRAYGKFQAVWFASDDYLNMWPGGVRGLNGTTEIMASPVILGVRSSTARRLGWEGRTVTWQDIASAAMRRQFTFAMTDPSASNSGLSALVSVATALAGKGKALQAAQIPAEEAELSALFHAQVMTAPTSGPLTQKYEKAQGSGGNVPDGLFDYESLLQSLPPQPGGNHLDLIYPSDGVLEATYPLSVLAGASPAAKDAYQRLAACLTSPPVQKLIMTQTHRRPIAGSPPLAGSLASHQPFVLPFPSAPATVENLITAYHGTLRTAGRTVYVLDTSGSMRGARLDALKQALLALTGADTSLTGKLTRFQANEQITFLPFGTSPGKPVTFNLPSAGTQHVIQQMRGAIAGLRIHGTTDLYGAIEDAYRIIGTQTARDPGRISSIVVLTDGENTNGPSLPSFLQWRGNLPAGSPPVYTIAFGNASLGDLAQVANATGGTSFNATGQPLSALTNIFEAIRGYQ